MSALSPAELSTCTDLLTFIDAAPTPFHAVAGTVTRLSAARFSPLSFTDVWQPLPAGRYYVTAGDGAIIAFVIPESACGRGLRGFRIVGAHTDSPNLRLKPRPLVERLGYAQLGVEVYGSPLLNSWLDRDLFLAGRVVHRGENGALRRQLVQLRQPLVRVAQLAIHLDREVNEKGVLLNRQEHLSPILGFATDLHEGQPEGAAHPDIIRRLCAEALQISAESIVTTELMLADANPATRGGLGGELIFAPRLDNLGMSHAGLSALLRIAEASNIDAGIIPIVALFDHEEVGSGSAYGAQSPVLPNLLERIVYGFGLSRDDYLRAVSGSLCVSADMAHAVHPNYVDRHEAHHRPLLNHGPVIKINSQQRYATCGRTAALFSELCNREEIAVQQYVARTDMPCGSTIGPITATLLGIPTVDVGNAMLSMHSARECAGARDPERMTRVLSRFLRSADSV
jgi:aspartyl aminopeptidase